MTSYQCPSIAELECLYLDGEFVKSTSKETFTISNPTNNTEISNSIPFAGVEDVDKAVRIGERAFTGEWSQFTALRRSAVLNKLADLLDEHLDTILQLDLQTGGIPLSALTKEKALVTGILRYYAGWCDKQRGDYFPPDDGFVKLVRHEPLGVCAAICPFNLPLGSLFNKIAPALATGNVVIAKPSEKTPLSALAIGPLFEAAGIPRGVYQVVTGLGSTGELLAKHMQIRKISFTGSVATGRKIQVAAAQSNLKRVTLELGGKSPAVIFEDADLDNAVTWTVRGVLARSGQVCVAASRVYVHESIVDKFIDAYVGQVKAAVQDMGDPMNPKTLYGPLVDSQAFKRVTAMIERAKSESELVVGGGIFGSPGFFVEPTVFVNPQANAQILTEEVFGPVSVVKTFKTEDEVVQQANDTEFGLMSGVFTTDITRALRVSSRIDAGVVGINCIGYVSLQAPFGGKKQSGIGREYGDEALRAFTEPKTILINMNASSTK